MEKCLVTKLTSAVNNNSILRIGEVRMSISKVGTPTDATQGFSVIVNNPVNLEIISDGYFTDKNLTQNLGTKMTLVPGSHSVWVSNSNVEVSISNKYNLIAFNSYYQGQATGTEFGENIKFCINDLKYSIALSNLNLSNAQVTGDIANLKGLTSLVNLNLSNTQVTGDIANLKGLTSLVNFRVSNTQITGDIANLKGLTSLATINLSNTQITGDIANLKGLTSLVNLNLSNTQVTGDIANLKGLTSLATSLKLELSGISGNLGDLPDNVLFFSNGTKKSSFTWTKSSRKNILALDNIVCDNIDDMLNDMSKMEAKFGGENNGFKTISLIGSRTSASDEAVATLQSKGYTVSITPA